MAAPDGQPEGASMPAMHGDLGVKAAQRSAALALVQRRLHAQGCRRQQATEQAVPKGFTWMANARIASARERR